MSQIVEKVEERQFARGDRLPNQIRAAWRTAVQALYDEQQVAGHWTGKLSTSALSTATAISALVEARKQDCIAAEHEGIVDESIAAACRWLVDHQNADGGFGDTDRSHSNVATTLLVLAAWELVGQADAWFKQHVARQQLRAWEYVDARGRWEGLRRRYGQDKTFVVPILSNCALAGLVPWSDVAPLPFEAAWLPQDWYRWARMPVVSYAIPALVAIGQARFLKKPPRNFLLRRLRTAAMRPTLRVLRCMQPASGGYLEAVPLTSFVLMNLAAVGNGSLPVAQDCIRFLIGSRLEDGSWPIDTNLSTWLTSLSISALARRQPQPLRVRLERDGSGSPRCATGDALPAQAVRWLLRCQHKQRHPFTGANPGGWGWTNLSGAVPDADDTPAALLALHALDVEQPRLRRLKAEIDAAVESGVRWLLRMQNRDGGWPTFCRGWGKLPFDRSGTDLTAHALRAIEAWGERWRLVPPISPTAPKESELRRATARGLRFLARTQQGDGSWLPLWFGNQDHPREDNPVYGTGKVLLAYAALQRTGSLQAAHGVDYLRKLQNPDGGWGGGPSVAYPGLKPQPRSAGADPSVTSSVEETAIALEGLLECGGDPREDATIMRGLGWLAEAVQQGATQRATPIGFYFAKLWYYERLYPTIFSVGALGMALRKLGASLEHDVDDDVDDDADDNGAVSSGVTESP